MVKPLSHIAQIKSGSFFRAGNTGDVLLYNIADFSETGKLTRPPKAVLPLAEVPEKALLQPGDVLFAAKGPKNFAWHYPGLERPAVASSSFYVIRLKNTEVLPEYLAWYLNQPSIIRRLKRKAEGTSMPLIRMEHLKNLPVVIPSPAHQKTIIAAQQAAWREQEILDRLQNLKNQLYQTLLWQSLKTENNE